MDALKALDDERQVEAVRSAEQSREQSPARTREEEELNSSQGPKYDHSPVHRPMTAQGSPPLSTGHVAGYKGHIHGLQHHFGAPYAVLTRRALSPPPGQQPGTAQEHVRVEADSRALPVPGYQGHVPGQRKLFGHTHGDITRAALEDPGLGERRLASPGETLEPQDAEERTSSWYPQSEGEPLSLVKTEKHHIPGYVGYVPALKDQLGLPYGSATQNALDKNSPAPAKRLTTTYQDIGGNERPPESRIPGFSGFVPELTTHISTNYTTATKKSLDKARDLSTRAKENDHYGEKEKAENTTRWSGPPPSADKRASFNNPQPHHVPGYTAFVPKYKSQFGATYGECTARALDPENLAPHEQKLPTNRITVGPQHHVAGFSGFVPQMADRVGMTYADGTRKSLESHSQSKRPVSADGVEATTIDPSRANIPTNTSRAPPATHKVPGYSGHLPGAHAAVGKSYGDISRNTKTPTYKEGTNPLAPSDLPKPINRPPSDHRVPGFSGFVPGFNDSVGRTFGLTTRSLGVGGTRNYGSLAPVDVPVNRKATDLPPLPHLAPNPNFVSSRV
eukprot:gnl/Hemi2/6043_TR2090_c0_g1_i1.p1 gnl/Hemi2/6043_TR2090_c0_g1~~gnl/Hemi2/6043_TR2090_c0_g1_i1.p1  ORF type:complete len:580 (-),score=126.03 gnl/Hemi2/6043_TR2090_c0_g1_i1:232-1920(-)